MIVVADGVHGGRCLALPLIPLDRYLAHPRHARWPFFLAVAMFIYGKITFWEVPW